MNEEETPEFRRLYYKIADVLVGDEEEAVLE